MTSNNTIRKVVIATGAVTTLAGTAGVTGAADGTGAAARFNGPYGIASDGAGNLFVADTGNHTIRKIVIATGAVTTLAGAASLSGSAEARPRPRASTPRMASPATGRATSSSPTSSTAPSARSSSRPGPSPRSRAPRV